MRERSKLASSLGAFLRVMCDLMILNILWIVCSLPVVTIGPATSALCCVSLKLARNEPIQTLRSFFTAFRRGIGQSILLGLLGLLGLVIAVVDWRFTVVQTGGMRTLFFVVSVIVSMVVLSYWAWAFALHARFENSFGGIIRNALSLAFVEPGKTVLIWIAMAVPVASFLLLPEMAVIYIGFLYILFAASAPAYFAARSQIRVFARFGDTEMQIEPEESNFYQ